MTVRRHELQLVFTDIPFKLPPAFCTTEPELFQTMLRCISLTLAAWHIWKQQGHNYTYIQKCCKGGHHILRGMVDDPLVLGTPLGVMVTKHVWLAALCEIFYCLFNVNITEPGQKFLVCFITFLKPLDQHHLPADILWSHHQNSYIGQNCRTHLLYIFHLEKYILNSNAVINEK